MKISAKQQQRLEHAFQKHETGCLEAAADDYRSLLRAMPASTVILSNLGMVLLQMGQRNEGVSLLERSLRIEPRQPAAMAACAMAYVELQQPRLALESATKAASMQPSNLTAHHVRGLALHMLGEYQAAVDAYRHLLVIEPNHIEAYTNLGLSLAQLNDIEGALNSFDQAIRMDLLYLPAHLNRLRLLRLTGQQVVAIASCENLLEIAPSSIEIRAEYALLLEVTRQLNAAHEQYQRLIGLDDSNVDAWSGLARIEKLRRKPEAALAAYKKVYALDAKTPFINNDLIELSLELCDWSNLNSLLVELSPTDLAKGIALRPFNALRLPIGIQYQQTAAQYQIANELSGAPEQRKFDASEKHTTKLRVGVVSSDLHNHPVAYLLEALLPSLNRERFELIGLPTSNVGVPETRRTLFNEWHDLSNVPSDKAIENLLELDLHLVLNLNGFTFGERSELFVSRIAPLQINFLGYAGTLGANFFDYIVADEYVIPPQYEEFYDEKIARLPDTFFVPNLAEVSPSPVSRIDEGLPERGVVFCCFNNIFKITPAVFDVWMRLLARVPGSVLWLSQPIMAAELNLRQEAVSRGIDPARLVFATRRESRADHLNRLALADIFLDTFYYNAHTTASDALWVGVPVVTYPGETFASRVAGSLLKAAGMDDLITDSREAYEAKALQLAQDPALLAETRARLARNKETYPIFDMPRYARNFERLLWAMWARYEQGLPPAPIRLDD